MESTTVRVPEHLIGSYERYGQLVKAERVAFRYRTLPTVFICTAVIVLDAFLGFLPSVLFSTGVPFIFLVPVIAMYFFAGNLIAERKTIQRAFAEVGLGICHDTSLRVDVVRL